MSAKPITFTYPRDDRCTINIDFNGNEYLIQWQGAWQEPPSLAGFPIVADATIIPIPHSSSVNNIWSQSEVLTFGADAHIRYLNFCNDEYPICKVAIDDRQRRLLRDEFNILRHLATYHVPAVHTHPQPLVDEHGVFGFRMEKLAEIGSETAEDYIPEIEKAVNSIHQCGVVLHDISPSNIMLDERGHVTIVDFGRAGYIGENIPPDKAIGLKPTVNTFSISADRIALDRTIGFLTRRTEG